MVPQPPHLVLSSLLHSQRSVQPVRVLERASVSGCRHGGWDVSGTQLGLQQFSRRARQTARTGGGCRASADTSRYLSHARNIGWVRAGTSDTGMTLLAGLNPSTRPRG